MTRSGRHTTRIRSGALEDPDWPPPDDAGYADHVWLAEEQPLELAVYQQTLAELGQMLDGIASGLEPHAGAWRHVLGRLGVTPAESSGERPDARWMPPSTERYATMALDADPALVDDATSALLGPWSAQLSARVPWHRRAMVAAVAAACFTIPPGGDRSGLRTWYRDKPQPGRRHRERVRMACRSPYLAWRLVDFSGQGWRVAPLVPIRSWWCPSEPVCLEDAGWVDDGPCEGGMLFARMVPTPEGWQAIAPLVLPSCPPAPLLRGWLALVEDPQLVVNRSLRREEVLHRRGHVMCGWAHQWWWSVRHRAAASRLGSRATQR